MAVEEGIRCQVTGSSLNQESGISSQASTGSWKLETGNRPARKGFTLFELMVVIIIIMIVAGVTAALMGVFLKGQSVRQGVFHISTAFQHARFLAADQRVTHFLVFIKGDKLSPAREFSSIEVHRDGLPTATSGGTGAPDKIYRGDNNPATAETIDDPQVQGRSIDLPKNAIFFKSPDWIGVQPTGFCTFDPNFTSTMKTSPAIFDKQASNPTQAVGEIILADAVRQNYFMCLDIDPGAGRVRRSYFYNAKP